MQELEERVAQLETQLAGCTAAAMGATDDVATEGDYGWSPAYQDVLELRQKHDALLLARSGAIGSLCDDTHYYSALLLARIIAGEAVGCPFEAKVAVAHVYENRIEAKGIEGGWFGDADPTLTDQLAAHWYASFP